MTRLEYIEDLVTQGLSSKEIYAKAQTFDADNETEEEVKIDDTQSKDAAVVSTTNEASNTVSKSSDGTSLSEEEAKTAAELKDAKQLIEDSLFDKTTTDKLIIESDEIYNGLEQDITNLTTRDEEGEIIAKEALEDQKDRGDFEVPEAVENFFKPIQEGLANVGGDAYSFLTKTYDKITSGSDDKINELNEVINNEESTPEQIENAEKLIKKLEEIKPSDVSDLNQKTLVKDSKEVKDFDLLKETQQTVARDYLFKEGNKNPSGLELSKYIEKNSQNEDFKIAGKKIFQDKYIKQRQKEAIIEKNKKESGWDGFTEGENQDRLEEAAALVSSSLDKEAQSNIATSSNIDSQIQGVEKELMALKKLKPNSQEEANLIINKANLLLQERQGLVDAYGDIVNRQIEIGTESKDIKGYLNTVSRNQGWLVNPLGALAGGAYDIVDGVDEFIDRMSYSPYEMAIDVVKSTTDKDSWVHQAVVSMEGLEKTNFGADTAIKNMREGLAEPISVSDIDNWSDMWQWSSHLVGSQAANTAVMLTTGGWALPLLGASSAGASFNSMQEEIDLYGAEYTPLQMYTVALGTGLAEALSERITLGQLNRIKKGLRASSKTELKKGTRDYIKNLFTKKGGTIAAKQALVYGKETFEEGFTEAVSGFSSRALERYVLGKDVSLFDGMLDEFVSGAFMSGFVYKAPGLGIKMYEAFQPNDSNQNIGTLKTRNIEIGKILNNSPLLDPKIRKKLEDELQGNATEIQQIMATDFKNMDKMSQQEQNDLMSKEDQIYNLRELYDTTLNDGNINEKDRSSILKSLKSELSSIKNDKNRLLSEVSVREEISLAQKIGKETGKTDFGENAVGTGQAVEIVEDDDAFKEMTGINESGVEGTELESGQIVLNKAQMLAAAMRNGGNIGTGIHEVLHKVLKSEFSSKDPVKAEKLKTQFLKILKSEDRSVYDKVMARVKANYSVPYLLKNPDEYITTFASVLKENNIEYSQATDGLFKKLANFIGGLFSDNLEVDPKDFKFKDGKDLYNFVQTYVKNTSEGNISERAKKLAESGKDIKAGDKMSRTSVLEAINELVPKDITTKAEYDAFLADPRANKPLFDALLLEGGVINNYVRSRTTTQAETDKAIESLQDRIMNFNPESKRADGTVVGMQGFGEAIFANTRFAKLDAKKALYKEGEKAKQEKSIDEGTLQISNDTATSKANDIKLAKKPSETTSLDKETEKAIDEAVNKNFEGKEIGFPETRNVPQEVADIYGEMFGLNPETIVSKKRNYQKTDSEGLTRAKQFLLKNAKNDYDRLPEAKNDLGKGTFIPKNVMDALYTDGKLTASLKDYMELIRQKPTKAIYRDRVGQTIRGLLNLHIRNRMLETAQPSQPKRVQSGAKFSKNKPFQIPTNNQNGIETLRDNYKAFAKENNIDIEFEGEKINLNNLDADNPVHKKWFKNSIETELFKYIPLSFFNSANLASAGDRLDLVIKYKQFFTGKERKVILKKAKENLKKYEKENGEIYTKEQLKDASRAIAKEGFVKNPYKYGTPEYQERINSTFRGEKIILQGFANAIKANPANALPIFALFSTQSSSSSHFVRQFAVSRGITGDFINENRPGKNTKEHVDPSNDVGPLMFESTLLDRVNDLIPFLKQIYYQLGITKIQDDGLVDTSGQYGEAFTYKKVQTQEFIKIFQNALDKNDASLISRYAPLLRYLNDLVNNNFIGGKVPFNTNTLYIDGVSVASELTFELPIELQTADVIIKQNQISYKIITGEITKAQGIKDLKAALPVNTAKSKRGESLAKQFTPKLDANTTTERKVEILNNYDTTSKLSRSLNTKPKGISVFDFDDTLAKTKEKVIVISDDGKIKEISAAIFAEQADDLETAGATFDFSNFENVVNAKKGPLADLALKRQGKFGSKDIFVLTARPQIAATGIKKFLDGIGLNLPLQNITGLENGTPQAKATWVVSKTAQGYNDFYFADDAIKNVKAVKEILDQVDVKSKVQQAKYSKSQTFDKIMNDIIENKTGIKSEAEFSKARAQTIGAKKGRFTFFATPSAEDFKGLLYRLLGKGKVGDAQMQFIQDNLIDPYNRAELAVTRAKISIANDFKALKNSLKTLPKSLSKPTGIGGFTFGQAARVAVWTRQGMEVPGLSKRDAKELNDFVDNNPELNVFADELIKIQKGKPYPAPGQNWLAGNITSDIINEINKVSRVEYMQEFNENLDIILSDKVMNKLEAAYGPRYVEALRDQIRRMKSGSNRPVGNSRIVDQLLNWLNNSVGAIMFLNTRSAVLQTISAVNFINFGNNNLIAAGRAFANQKQYWKDFMTLFNSPYLVERRDGLKINVSESEIADAVSESSNKPKAFLNMLLSKGFVLTRFADSFAIASGGSTFYRNQIKAYMKSGMDQKAAEKQAFDDFYAIAEENQQSSNPSKISQQQASGAGRVILAFANTPMQYARIIKRASQDLANGRGDWKSNVSKIVYYSTMQNLLFAAMSNALFAAAFDEEGEEEENDKTGRIANSMADSLLRGLGIQGAAVAAVKDALFTIYEQANKEKGAPEFRKAINDLFGFSPPLDSKIRKLNSGANTLSWEQEKMKEEGYNLNNPAYLAAAQIISSLTNLPLDRAIQKINNIRAATSDSSAKWQKVALLMGWSAWDLGLPYYGVEDKEVQTPQTILRDKVLKMKKETSGKEQKQMLLDLGLTKQEIVKLKYEEIRIKKIIELQNKN